MNASFSIEIGADEILHEFRLVSCPATVYSYDDVEFSVFKDGVEVDPDLTEKEIERIVEGLLRQTRE